MTIGWVGIILAIAGVSLLTSCSAQNSSSGSQTASAQSAAGGAGCEIDAKKVCQQIADQPVVDAATGLTLDPREREQSGFRTISEHMTFSIPNGSVVEVDCQINAAHGSVVYAHTLPGPALTETDVQFLRSNSLCVQ